MESLPAIQERVLALAHLIGAPDSALPTFGGTEDGARPHVEVDDCYHLVVVERGQELERRSTSDLDELLYWVFATVVFSMAVSERPGRKPGEDSRRRLFERERALLRALKPDWARRRKAEQAETLAQHPFTDQPGGIWSRFRKHS